MIIYTDSDSPRLQYIASFIAKELSDGAAQVTTLPGVFREYDGHRINYSSQRLTKNETWIRPHPLLFENGIQPQSISCSSIHGYPAFFQTEGDFPFDIFAASFFLLSRYEEYLPHEPDLYGRYAFENSLAHKEGFLNLPLINIWIKDFRQHLQARFSPANKPDGQGGEDHSTFNIQHSTFKIIPTYDIDIAWSYRHKGFWRNAGGTLRGIAKGNFQEVRQRIRVLLGRERDPFDSFAWLHQLHEKHRLKPYYFFLVPEKRGRYDKNISPRKKAMRELVRDHVIRYPVGIHPSWKSGDDDRLLKEEIDRLSSLNGNPVRSSRYHYIRFKVPEGYRRLLANGIRFDFSMGYGSINGFRASVASPFFWYDLEKEEQTDLLLFPFCFMEANSFYEQKFTAEQAFEELLQYHEAVKSVNGYFIMIWHNSFLGNDPLYKGWKGIYEQFIQIIDVN